MLTFLDEMGISSSAVSCGYTHVVINCLSSPHAPSSLILTCVANVSLVIPKSSDGRLRRITNDTHTDKSLIFAEYCLYSSPAYSWPPYYCVEFLSCPDDFLIKPV